MLHAAVCRRCGVVRRLHGVVLHAGHVRLRTGRGGFGAHPVCVLTVGWVGTFIWWPAVPWTALVS